MPKQKSRTRRKAAPQSIEEDVPNLVEEQSEIPPLYRPPVRRRKTRRAVPETITEQPSVPTANDIADALFRKFESSGVQLVKDNTAVPINDLTGMLSSSSTQPENSSNNDSQGQMLAVFQPPLSSDPNINTSSDGELLNSNSYAENPYACDMLRHSIPLDYHVSSKVKSDVWCDNYVNFALLLPSNIDDTCNESTLFENLNITISNRKSNKELLSIHQWTNAFDIFMSIYLEKNLRSARALIKYGFNVRSLCKSLGFQAAKVYDEKFRKIRKILGLQWDQINDELWRSAALYERQSDFSGQNKKSYAKTSNSAPNSFQRRAQHQYQFPNGYCWAFCKSGECTAKFCKLKHQCVHCSKKHCTLTCPEQKGKQANFVKTSNTNKG
ncbi:unnamed protein product [Mytilus edulis]|uniref:C3H1-type domain-containing protein n=2 Tax=Mytilus TaxID=6548 RepID=A0A8B6D3P7_MYTGA|nr:unnamed protein product [Mytilus edulis]VDH92755.1 Hypothetical predicted protein [Mytilus galloprovincialis]VDI14059.1 Hypothetical predicted protein [Mytilus galloprovincialis]